MKRVVTLVHGTFAAHGDWIQDGHGLPVALTRSGDTLLDRFCWSGRNRHRDRLKAGDDLRRHLVALISSSRKAGATAEHHVVAHSHGGNVALYALRDRGDADDARLAGVKVITLGTPFLCMRERPLPKRLYVMLVGLLVGTAYSLVELGSGNPTLAWTVLYGAWSALGIGAIVALVWSVLLYRLRRGAPSLWALVTGGATLEEQDRLTAPEVDPARLFVVRSLGDEASGVLGAAQLTTWTMAKLADLLSPKSWFLALFLGGVIAGIIGTTQRTDDLIFTTLTVFLLAATQLIASFIVLANLPFGTDSLFWNLHALTTAEATPRGRAEVLVVGWRHFHFQKGSHAVYDDPEAQVAIASRIGSAGDPGEA